MPPPLHVILWTAPGRSFESPLLGRPVWDRTRDALAKLSIGETLLVTDDAPSAAVDRARVVPCTGAAAALRRLKGDVLILPAELPCLRARSLGPLLRRKRGAPVRMAGPRSDAPLVRGEAAVLARRLDKQRGSRALEAVAEGLPHVPSSLASAEDFVRANDAQGWARASGILRRRKCDELMRRGVLIDDPATIQVDPEVRVGRGTRLRGWILIEGESRLGARCDVGPFTHIVDSTIGAETVVLDHCYIRSSRLGRRVQVGPFAHLRPESVVGSAAKVGNFVELKKTILGEGSKAPHLSYLGDARIGRNVNVGAGTITCNYDGRLKHPTVIGDGAFIGSDVQLVAPVRVGRGAYVAAGSCIVEDVPPRSLALARSRQTIKPHWAEKKRLSRRSSGSSR